MTYEKDYFLNLGEELTRSAKAVHQADLETINLVAPASPTPRRYLDIPLTHNEIVEGLLENRPYAGVAGADRIEAVAAEAACVLFGADHANVQPHSVSQANQAVYQALLEPNDRVLAMRFDAGGHLTHGMKRNFSGKFYDFDFYGVDENGFLNYEEIETKAQEFKPKMIVCGASSYPRIINLERLGEISRKIDAYLMADLSHPAGLIVGNRFPKPFPHCDVVTLTLDKTMLGPHGGIILCKKELKTRIDKGVHPGVQSSVPIRRIYQMAQCLIDSSGPWFADFVDRVIKNMKVLEAEFDWSRDLMITGGSDTHLMVLNTLKAFNLTGKEAEKALEEVGIWTNRQVIPRETLPPYEASGIRLGTTWITARGYDKSDTKEVAQLLLTVLKDPKNEEAKKVLQGKVRELAKIRRKDDVWGEEV